MSKFKFYHGLVMPFYSRDFYRDVASHWKGKAFLTLLTMLAICWILILGSFSNKLNYWLDNTGQKIINQIPVITIENGTLSIQVDMPYFVEIKDKEIPLIAIDTTGEIKTLKDTEAKILITESTIYIEKNQFETQNYDLTQIAHFELTHDTLNHWINLIKGWFFIAAFPFVLIGSFIYRVILTFFFTIPALIINSLMDRKLIYDSLIQLSAVAMIPAIVLKGFFMLLNVSIPYFWFLSFFITVIYLGFAIQSVAHAPDKDTSLV